MDAAAEGAPVVGVVDAGVTAPLIMAALCKNGHSKELATIGCLAASKNRYVTKD